MTIIAVTVAAAGMSTAGAEPVGTGLAAPGSTTTGSTATGSTTSTSTLWNRHMVWASLLVQGSPTDLGSYGANYPLHIPVSSGDRALHDVTAAKAAGVDGLAIVAQATARTAPAPGIQLPARYLDAADANGMIIAPDVTVHPMAAAGASQADRAMALVSLIRQWIALNTPVAHRSAARIGGALVIFVYHAQEISPDGWKKINLQLGNTPVLLVSDLRGVSGKAGWSFPADYLPYVDIGYSEADLGAAFAPMKQFIAPKRFIGGMWAGYYRGQVNAGHPSGGKPITPFGDDAFGTSRMRVNWAVQGNLQWVKVATWNDHIEHTNIGPSSDWNVTRSELNAFEAAKSFGDRPFPFSAPRLYLTTPQALYRDQAGEPVEALAVNPTARPVTVTVRCTDGTGGNARSATVTVPARSAAAATVLVSGNAAAGTYLKATATLTGPAGALASVRSAPVLTYPVDSLVPGTTRSRVGPTLYYSVPAARAISKPLVLSVKRSSVAGHVTVALTGAGGSRVRYSELLHDTQSVKKVAGSLLSGSVTTSLTADPVDNRGDSADHHWYIARVIDDNGNVAYSNPVFLA